MLRRCDVLAKEYRAAYNLASKNPEGRRMTGHITAYRHWMWKQNELWRNVHEAQFEHTRNVYRRQWYEAFRVNADEYIHKYNITKAAQLAHWEREMHAQEAKRVEAARAATGRQQLQRKHRDLLREYHERHFFYWFERASERLQAMTRIKYVAQDAMSAHIERELDKYVVGKSTTYPLNFAGQMPLLEDSDCNVVQVPEGLLTNYTTETKSAVAAFQPRSSSADGDAQLRAAISANEQSLFDDDAAAGDATSAAALAATVSETAREEDAQSDEVRVARSMEESDADRNISRRSYIDRGRVGGKTVFMAPRGADGGSGGGGGGAAPPPPPLAGPPKKNRTATQRRIAEGSRQLGETARKLEAMSSVQPTGDRKRLRDRLVLTDALRQAAESPIMKKQAEGRAEAAISKTADESLKSRREEQKQKKGEGQRSPRGKGRDERL